jgi:hypothetical protein
VPSQPAHRVGSECTREPSGNLPIHTGPPQSIHPYNILDPLACRTTPARFRTSASNTSLAAWSEGTEVLQPMTVGVTAGARADGWWCVCLVL